MLMPLGTVTASSNHLSQAVELEVLESMCGVILWATLEPELPLMADFLV